MHNFVVIIILIIMIAIMITSLVFATKSASDITKISVPNAKSWNDNTHLKDAHSMFTWLAVGGWIAVALIIFGLIVFLFTGGKEKIGGKANPVFIGLLLTVTGVTITVGVLSILASQDLAKAPNDPKYPFDTGSEHYESARKDGIISASLAIGVIGLIILMWIILVAARSSAKKSKEKAEEAEKVEAEKEEEKEEGRNQGRYRAQGEVGT